MACMPQAEAPGRCLLENMAWCRPDQQLCTYYLTGSHAFLLVDVILIQKVMTSAEPDKTKKGCTNKAAWHMLVTR